MMGELNLKRACCVYEILFGSLVPVGSWEIFKEFLRDAHVFIFNTDVV